MTAQHFDTAAQIWSLYLARKISMKRRDEMLAPFRDRLRACPLSR